MMPKRRSKFAVFVVAIAAVIYLGNLAIDNPYTHGFVNYYLNEKFLNQLPVRFEYQSMRVQLFPPAIQLFGVKVTNKQETQGAEEIFATSQVSFSVGLWSLFLAKPQLGDLELHDLTASWPPPPELLEALRALEPKRPNQIEAPPAWPPAQDPPLSSVTIHNAALRFRFDGVSISADQDPEEITWVTTDGAELQIDFRGWRDIRVRSQIQRMNVADRGSSYVEDATVILNGALTGNRFRSSEFTIQSARLNTAGSFDVDIQTASRSRVIESIHLSTSVDADADFSVLGSFIDLDATHGRLQAKATCNIGIPLEDKPVTLSVKGTATSRNAAISSFNLYQSEADFDIDMDGITFTDVRIKSGEAEFGRAKGRLLFSEGTAFNFQAKPKGLPLDTLLGVFNVPFDAVNFKLDSENLAITGRGGPFRMSVTADALLSDFSVVQSRPDSKYGKSPSCKMGLDLNINSREIIYDGSRGTCGVIGEPDAERFSLVLSGKTTFNDQKGMDLQLSSPTDFNLRPLRYFSGLDMSGAGKMNTRIYGPYSEIQIVSDFDLQKTVLGSVHTGSIAGKTIVTGDDVSWKDVVIRPLSGGTLNLKSGSLQFDEDLTMEASIHAAEIDHNTTLALMKDLAGPQASLEFSLKSLDASISGALLQPLRYQGDIDFTLEGVRDEQYEYASSMSGRIEGTKTGLLLRGGKYVLGTFDANVEVKHSWAGPVDPNFLGGLGMSQEDKLEVDIASNPTTKPDDQIQRFPILGELAERAAVKGTVNGTARFTGDFNRMSGLAKIRVEDTEIMSVPAPALAASIIVDGAKLDIMAEQGGNALKARVNMDLGSPGIPYNWYISTKNFDVRPLMPESFANDPRNFGYFTGTWSMQGSFEDWWESTGEIDIKRIRAKFHPPQRSISKPLEFSSVGPAHVTISRQGWMFDNGTNLSLKSDMGMVNLGLGENRPPEKLALLIHGSLRVDALKILSADIESATGQINFDGGIFGDFQEPAIDLLFTDAKSTAKDGQNWEPVSLGLVGYRPAFKEIQLRARLKNKALQVESFTSTKGSGTISGSGLYSFASGNEVQTDLNINLDNAAFVYPFPVVKNFDTSIDGAIHIGGQGFPLQTSGTLMIKKARSNREIDLREAIVESLQSSNNQTGPQSLQPNMIFDIRISAEESISFNSRNIQAVLSSNLHLSGSDIVPEISGLIEIHRGKFYYKRDFAIQRGLINFDDPIKPDPSLDIAAVSEVGGYRVNIAITGKASAPAIDFTVDPAVRPDGTAISKLEIITLLSRGSLPDNKLSGTSSAESTAATEALNLFAGQVEDTVEKIFDISGQNVIRQVYIDTYAGTDGAPVARFNLPLNITEDLDVILKVDQNTVKLSSEYALHDSISVTGGIESSSEEANNGVKQQGAPADTGVDIKFKFAFP